MHSVEWPASSFIDNIAAEEPDSDAQLNNE